MLSLLLFSRLSVDPEVPLMGEPLYSYGEGEVSRVKQPCTAFGTGGRDKLCPDCLDPPAGGTHYFYMDPTWDFSADEPPARVA
mmetsp:Transcript_36816/g.87128  ORF Transcript_36816/g.87128 Transcript_36816/m.87128 type:complete len:83 (+) Transcript_36816:127-375(+)